MEEWTVERVLEQIRRIEAARKPLKIVQRSEVYPVFESEDGWKICVFCDCGDWEYIDWIESPAGLRWWAETGLTQHRPTEAVEQTVYRWKETQGYYWIV